MKRYIFAVIVSVVFAAAAMAQYSGPSNQSVISIADAKTLSDDTNVQLEGRIERHLHGDKYLLTDKTGSIVVEIDEKEWKNVTVSEKDTVRIHGEVEKSLFRSEAKIDTESIEVIK